MQHVTDFLAKTVTLWHRQFATMFVPLACDLLQKVLSAESGNEGSAKIIMSEFEYGELSAALKNMHTVSGRYKPFEVRTKDHALLQLRIGFALLKTNKLGKRIQGLKQIREQVKIHKDSAVKKAGSIVEEFLE